MLHALKRQGAGIAIGGLALFVALGGPAAAAKLIDGKDIKNNTITNAKLKKNTITNAKLKKNTITSGKIRNKTISAADVKDGSLTAGQLARGQFARSLGMVRVVATSGVDESAARANAKPVVLHQAGALTLYAKCFNDETNDRTYYEVYLKTSRNGAVMDSRWDSLYGGPAATDFLNTATAETDRRVERDSTGANSASSDSADESDFAAFAPDGSWMRGWSAGFVKRGNLAGGNGVYGAGNVCLFNGVVASS